MFCFIIYPLCTLYRVIAHGQYCIAYWSNLNYVSYDVPMTNHFNNMLTFIENYLELYIIV